MRKISSVASATPSAWSGSCVVKRIVRPRRRKPPQQAKDNALICKIERGCRFVEDQNAAIGGKRARKQHQLALTAAQSDRSAAPRYPTARPHPGILRAYLVASARRAETPEIAASPQQNHIDGAIGLIGEQGLRHEADWPSAMPGSLR